MHLLLFCFRTTCAQVFSVTYLGYWHPNFSFPKLKVRIQNSHVFMNLQKLHVRQGNFFLSLPRDHSVYHFFVAVTFNFSSDSSFYVKTNLPVLPRVPFPFSCIRKHFYYCYSQAYVPLYSPPKSSLGSCISAITAFSALHDLAIEVCVHFHRKPHPQNFSKSSA